jgi:hypothetical protein
MTQLRTLGLLLIAVFVVGPSFFVESYRTAAQDKKLKITIQAQAMGTSTQLGQTFNITAIVNEISPAEDQKILLDAFQAKGNEGLVNALSKMHSKGRLAITGTLGGDLAYIRRFRQPDGTTVIRMITNRLLRFGEVWYDSRSTDYQLSGLEIVVGKDKKKATGTLLPAAQLKMDKKGQLEIENYQNPWKLTNIRLR